MEQSNKCTWHVAMHPTKSLQCIHASHMVDINTWNNSNHFFVASSNYRVTYQVSYTNLFISSTLYYHMWILYLVVTVPLILLIHNPIKAHYLMQLCNKDSVSIHVHTLQRVLRFIVTQAVTCYKQNICFTVRSYAVMWYKSKFMSSCYCSYTCLSHLEAWMLIQPYNRLHIQKGNELRTYDYTIFTNSLPTLNHACYGYIY